MSGSIQWVYPFYRHLHYFQFETGLNNATVNIHSQDIFIHSGPFSPSEISGPPVGLHLI